MPLRGRYFDPPLAVTDNVTFTYAVCDSGNRHAHSAACQRR